MLFHQKVTKEQLWPLTFLVRGSLNFLRRITFKIKGITVIFPGQVLFHTTGFRFALCWRTAATSLFVNRRHSLSWFKKRKVQNPASAIHLLNANTFGLVNCSNICIYLHQHTTILLRIWSQIFERLIIIKRSSIP
jgi:hypothetical protein